MYIVFSLPLLLLFISTDSADAADDNPVTVRFLCRGNCCDHHEWCRFWASVGECRSNKEWMVDNCQLACGTCRRGPSRSPRPGPGRPPRPGTRGGRPLSSPRNAQRTRRPLRRPARPTRPITPRVTFRPTTFSRATRPKPRPTQSFDTEMFLPNGQNSRSDVGRETILAAAPEFPAQSLPPPTPPLPPPPPQAPSQPLSHDNVQQQIIGSNGPQENRGNFAPMPFLPQNQGGQPNTGVPPFAPQRQKQQFAPQNNQPNIGRQPFVPQEQQSQSNFERPPVRPPFLPQQERIREQSFQQQQENQRSFQRPAFSHSPQEGPFQRRPEDVRPSSPQRQQFRPNLGDPQLVQQRQNRPVPQAPRFFQSRQQVPSFQERQDSRPQSLPEREQFQRNRPSPSQSQPQTSFVPQPDISVATVPPFSTQQPENHPDGTERSSLPTLQQQASPIPLQNNLPNLIGPQFVAQQQNSQPDLQVPRSFQSQSREGMSSFQEHQNILPNMQRQPPVLQEQANGPITSSPWQGQQPSRLQPEVQFVPRRDNQPDVTIPLFVPQQQENRPVDVGRSSFPQTQQETAFIPPQSRPDLQQPQIVPQQQGNVGRFSQTNQIQPNFFRPTVNTPTVATQITPELILQRNDNTQENRVEIRRKPVSQQRQEFVQDRQSFEGPNRPVQRPTFDHGSSDRTITATPAGPPTMSIAPITTTTTAATTTISMTPTTLITTTPQATIAAQVPQPRTRPPPPPTPPRPIFNRPPTTTLRTTAPQTSATVATTLAQVSTTRSRRNFARCQEILRDPLVAAEEMWREHLIDSVEDNSQRRTLDLDAVIRSNLASACVPRMDESSCERNICYNAYFRTMDGTCNNLQNPLRGAAYRPYTRLLPTIYDNELSEPIGSLFPNIRPSPREITRHLTSSHASVVSDDYNALIMQFGQFISHDMAKTTLIPSAKCNVCQNITSRCMAVPIANDDPNMGFRRNTCVRVSRSSPICGSGNQKPRQQLNENTGYIDASPIYGSSVHDSEKFRQGKTGFLKLPAFNGMQMLPFDQTKCKNRQSCTVIFTAGDSRVNLFVGLSAWHTIFTKEHNRIVSTLIRLNPHWDGERLYQEARKIVGAELQAIVYREWLPKILGAAFSSVVGDYRGYDSTVDATIANEFTSAAFRFGHGMIQEFYQRLDPNFGNSSFGALAFQKGTLHSDVLVNEGGPDPLLRGMFSQSVKRPQRVTTTVTENMFGSTDLSTINIQRGRDHGHPSYSKYRELCGMGVATTFDHLSREILNTGTRDKLEKVYGSVDRIDLWVGALLEDPVVRGLVGPTIACIVGPQFKRTRDGDRFYYENPGVFTRPQLSEIRKSSLSRIMCDNTNTITMVPREAFRLGHLTPCSQIPQMDLSKWKE